MNSSAKTDTQTTPESSYMGAVLTREAGLPFRPPLGYPSGGDPIAEWLSLMEVVQMLCPVWPVPEKRMRGTHWLL